MNAKPKTELNRCVFVQKRNSVNGALVRFSYSIEDFNWAIEPINFYVSRPGALQRI